jgi:subtilase family serine protease
MAPGANIVYYGARSCFDDDLLAALTRVVNQNRAQLVTNSWGDVEEAESAEGVRAYEKVFLQGAMQGISFMFSSGDNGDELQASGLRQADYPTSDPYVTSVGGTSTAIGADGSLDFNTGWGTEKYALSSGKWAPLGYLYGAGGGRSSLFNRPSYQDGIVSSPYRSVPDLAMDADPTTGMLVGETQTFPNGVRYDEYRIGGTSLASPLLAGFAALALQKSGGHGVGLLNPTLYSNARNGSFADVKGASPDPGNVRVDYANTVNAKDGLLYSIRTFNQDSSLSVKAGWDDVTGLGVPTPKWLKAAASS